MSSVVEVQVKIVYHTQIIHFQNHITVTKEFSKRQMAIGNLLKKDKC